MASKDLTDDPRFKFGPAPIQTAEDAVMAFLRKEINEDELRDACSLYGVVPGSLFNQRSAKPERIDAAYENVIPTDIFNPDENPEDTLENRQKMVDEKNKEREAAAKEAEKRVVGGVVTTEVEEGKQLPRAQELTSKK